LNPSPPPHWFPLATEQLRLRALTDVYLLHPTHGSCEETTFSLSFHTTPLSSPFFTLPPTSPTEEKVVWAVERGDEAMGGLRSLVVRLWIQDLSSSRCLAAWGVGLSGLTCIGDKLSRATASNLEANSLVFKMHQYYFVATSSLLSGPVALWRRTEVPNITVESGKPSYDRPGLAKLHSTLRALHQSTNANSLVTTELATRGLDHSGSDSHAAAPAQMGRTISSKILEVRMKSSATRKQEIFLAKRIEGVRFRIDSLRQERERLSLEVKGRRADLNKVGESLETGGDLLKQSKDALTRDKEKLEAWLASFTNSRESNRKSAEYLRIRRLQLISQLSEIFPIQDSQSSTPTICYVGLPSSDCLRERDDTDLAVGLGWVAHLTAMVSCLMGVPLRYPTTSAGSRSTVEDLILDRIPDKDREFPLFPKGNERVRFDYGVFLLNKNIAQLRWLCGETTSDAKPTLRNLAGLLNLCSTSSELPPSPEYRLPEARPVLAGTVLPTSTTDTEVEEPSQEVLVKEEAETKSESEQTSGNQIICDKEEKQGGVPTSPYKVSSPSLLIATSTPTSPSKSSPSICEEAPGDVSINGEAKEAVEEELLVEVEEPEVGVEAEDLFRDIALRTQALSAPTSFKSSQRQRYYK